MKSSDEIFQLINSMSDKEKRFFRKKYTLFVADDDGNYIKLFEEISKQIDGGGDYNEKKIKEGDYTGKFLKNLPFHKNYLYNTILNSLSIFHKDSKDAFAVRNLITQAEILSDKMLHEQSLKLLQRAKKTASEKDLLSSKYEIINIERTILKYSISAEDYASCFEDLFKEQNDILTIQKNLLIIIY
jgi:predicted nucleotide-binding protein (sugar kinase/HSP70/actin superfamily)